jgi:hypothetical protein
MILRRLTPKQIEHRTGIRSSQIRKYVKLCGGMLSRFTTSRGSALLLREDAVPVLIEIDQMKPHKRYKECSE